MNMDYEESYSKTMELLEEKIQECDDIKMKMKWLKAYKTIVLPEDQKEDVLNIDSFILDQMGKKGVNIYDYPLEERFMEEYSDKLNWTYISQKQELSRDFILRNRDIIDFDILNFNNYLKLEDSDIRDLSKKINWDYISMRDDLSIMFIREFKDLLNWSYVSINISFKEEEMEEFSEYLDWKMATLCQVYSDDFKDKHELTQYEDEMKKSSEKLLEEFEERQSKKDELNEEFYETVKKIMVDIDDENESGNTKK